VQVWKLANAPQAHVAVFVGTDFDTIKGRGGNDGKNLNNYKDYI
jgi:hypothetical protein